MLTIEEFKIAQSLNSLNFFDCLEGFNCSHNDSSFFLFDVFLQLFFCLLLVFFPKQLPVFFLNERIIVFQLVSLSAAVILEVGGVSI